MKKSIFLFAFASLMSLCSYAVTESELQDIADCMGAFSITNTNMQLNGDHENYKTGKKISSKLMDIFYDKLAEYKKQKPSIDEAYMGKMPNRAIAQYGYMNDLQQLKYASSVMKSNNCFQYAR